MPAPITELDDIPGPARLDLTSLMDQAQPVVIRGLCKDWPLVQQASRSHSEFARALAKMDSGTPVDVLELSPDAHGVVGYNEAMDGFNYRHFKLTVTEALKGLAARARHPRPAGVALQSALIGECLPEFLASHPMPCLPPRLTQPRLWLGNQVTTPAHFDGSHNLAVVVCGRRRFRLFPVEQVENLYIGPLDFVPAMAPITLARLDRPDHEQFPKLEQAREQALVVELEPGDALYLPPLWWHQVESLDALNALVNYWWQPLRADGNPPVDGMGALLHALLAFRDLPASERNSWRVLFEHYVFGDADPAEHIPPTRRGILGELDAGVLEKTRERIRRLLQ